MTPTGIKGKANSIRTTFDFTYKDRILVTKYLRGRISMRQLEKKIGLNNLILYRAITKFLMLLLRQNKAHIPKYWVSKQFKDEIAEI